MARSEKWSIVTRKHEPDHWVSHSGDCWMCGKGRRAKRQKRSKPRRQEGKRIIAEGREYWGDPVY